MPLRAPGSQRHRQSRINRLPASHDALDAACALDHRGDDALCRAVDSGGLLSQGSPAWRQAAPADVLSSRDA